MCDENSFDDMMEHQQGNAGALSRRQFGALGMGAGMVAMLPQVAGAADVTESEVVIKTADGSCDAHFVHPSSGAHAAVLVWPDIFGLRDPFRQMGKRLAESGYAVLTINPFYRLKKAPTAPERADMSNPEVRKMLIGQMKTLSADTALTDATAMIAWLDAQSAVDKNKKIGTTGYCMGGPLTMRTAAAFPDRVGAGGSFHGGGLVTDAPDSPHRLVSKMKAQYLIAIAENDDEKQPEAKDALRDAFESNKLKAEIEVYAGAKHGWCPPDSRVYNEAQAEKAWGRLLNLFSTSLA
jgi:carboxymethylenebutenolidase